MPSFRRFSRRWTLIRSALRRLLAGVLVFVEPAARLFDLEGVEGVIPDEEGAATDPVLRELARAGQRCGASGTCSPSCGPRRSRG